MNYKKHYDLLMERAKTRIVQGYVEKHHIIPRCLNGSDDIENIAILTPEEHFVAHQLLVKIYPKNRKLILAAVMMTTHNSEKRINNKRFGWLKQRFSEAMSGDNNPSRRNPLLQQEAGKKRVGQKRTEETKVKMSASQKGKVLSAEHITNLKKSAETRKKPMDSVPIYMYNEQGTFVAKYNSIYECNIKTGISRSMIKGVANGKNKHVERYRFTWKFLGNNINPLVIECKLVGVPKTEEHINNQKLSLSVRHTCIHCGVVSSKSAINRYHNNRCNNNPNQIKVTPANIKTHTCPHCNKSGKGSVMYRHHFDHCKEKK